MSEVADEIEHMDISAFACPPAGREEHFMVLALVAGVAGRFDEAHDFVAYPLRQQFLQPRMRGNVGYRIEGNRVHLSVEHIENPREAANCSGTLALELWALAAPYAGGAFQGTHLAGVSIGSLFGQNESTTTSFDLPFFAPPAGGCQFVLMLREWTPAGYVTRDFTNFIAPVNFRSPDVLTAPKTEKLEASEVKPPVTAKAAPTAPKVAVKPATKVNLGPRKTSGSKNAPKKRRPPAAAKAATALGQAPSVSVNTAAEEELVAIEGLSPQLARAIKKDRPFASLDELQRVKGMTAKILSELRSRLRV
jgi:DNA uptake protein ComE-like DNA-binding protein